MRRGLDYSAANISFNLSLPNENVARVIFPPLLKWVSCSLTLWKQTMFWWLIMLGYIKLRTIIAIICKIPALMSWEPCKSFVLCKGKRIFLTCLVLAGLFSLFYWCVCAFIWVCSPLCVLRGEMLPSRSRKREEHTSQPASLSCLLVHLQHLYCSKGAVAFSLQM